MERAKYAAGVVACPSRFRDGHPRRPTRQTPLRPASAPRPCALARGINRARQGR